MIKKRSSRSKKSTKTKKASRKVDKNMRGGSGGPNNNVLDALGEAFNPNGNNGNKYNHIKLDNDLLKADNIIYVGITDTEIVKHFYKNYKSLNNKFDDLMALLHKHKNVKILDLCEAMLSMESFIDIFELIKKKNNVNKLMINWTSFDNTKTVDEFLLEINKINNNDGRVLSGNHVDIIMYTNDHIYHYDNKKKGDKIISDYIKKYPKIKFNSAFSGYGYNACRNTVSAEISSAASQGYHGPRNTFDREDAYKRCK